MQQHQQQSSMAAAAAAAVNFYDFPMDRLLHRSGDYSVVPIRLPATLARAVYDNKSSYDSELDFKKGAILTVLDQRPVGLDGWWLCSYRGRNGIAPGNRLQLIGVLEAPEKPRLPPKAVSGPDLPPRNSTELQHQRGSSWDFYDAPDSVVRLSGPHDAAGSSAAAAAAASRRSSGISTSSATSAAAPAPALPPPRQPAGSSSSATTGGGKSVRFDDQEPPQQSGGQPIYAEVCKRPAAASLKSADDPEPYDDPDRLKRQISDTYDELPDVPGVPPVELSPSPTPEPAAQIPLRQKVQQPPPPPPPPPAPPSMSASSSVEDYQNLRGPVYQQQLQQRDADKSTKHTITKEFLDSLLAPGSLESAELHQRQAREARSYTPTSLDSVASEDIQFRPECRVHLDQAEAIRLLRELERDFGERCARMYRFVHSRWKTEASLALNAAGIRLTLREARGFLDQMIDFFHGVLNNSRLESCPDRGLARKLWKHLRAMEQSQAELGESVAQLDRLSWSPKALATASAAIATDHLGVSISALRELQIQQRTLSTTVHANALLLFPPLKQPQPQPSEPLHPSTNGDSGSGSNASLYMRMSSMNEAVNQASSKAGNLTRADREALTFFADRIDTGSRIYEAMCQDLSGALYSGQASLVVGALTKNAVSRGFKINQTAILLHDALHARQLRLRLEEAINRFGHHLKGILTASKVAMTATATTNGGMLELHGHIGDSIAALKEVGQVLNGPAENGASNGNG